MPHPRPDPRPDPRRDARREARREARRDDRRTPPRGSRPRGRTGPGRLAGTGRGRPLSEAGASAGSVGRAVLARRPRLTGRAAILLAVLAVLAVSYASSLRAYLEQRSHIVELKQQIAERQAAIADLEREKERWQDPAYVEAQARERFGYVMPGETAYVVLDEDGEPLQPESELDDPAEVLGEEPTAWWDDAWASVQLAGDPPRDQAPPAAQIDGSAEGDPEAE